jgi:pimeloyl-ACP methyl ester carboxylesterase
MECHQAAGNIFEHDGCALHYCLRGSHAGPLVVLTHGAAMDHHAFDLQLAALVPTCRVLTWDVRGHGLSRPARTGFSIGRAVDDILALLDHLGAAQAIFVGHSMGGNISQEVVFRAPERVRALVACGCTCNTLKLSGLERLQVGVLAPLLRLYPYELLKRQSARVSAVKPDVQQYLYEVFGHLSKAEFVQILDATAACLHYEPGYRITHPLLLTHGEHDRTGNIRMVASDWANRDPHCHYQVIPAAGHLAQLDNAAAFNQVLLAFLESL